MDNVWLLEPSIKSSEHFIKIALVWIIKQLFVIRKFVALSRGNKFQLQHQKYGFLNQIPDG